jgi:hypothetical protein
MSSLVQKFSFGIGLTFVTSAALVGCAADATSSQASAESPTANAAASLGGFDVASKPNGALLHSVTKDGHLIQFAEMEPGIGAVLEIGETGVKPLLDASSEPSLTALYQSLGVGEAPEVIRAAEARRLAHVVAAGVAPTASFSRQGAGPAYYNTAEQQWFRGQFCNGAEVCSQGWDWAVTGAVHSSNENFVGWVGSEGTTNASLWVEYWHTKSATWGIACGDCGSWWQEFYRVIVVPNHWATAHVWGASWFQGHLDGAGGGTQISLAARR